MKRYVTFCSQCYSCVLLETNSRKDANRAATGHQNAYGHEVHINDTKGGMWAADETKGA
jgi:hypothetical protein